MQEQARLTPDTDHLGLLTATVLLTFAMTRILPTPEFTVTLQVPGFYFAVPLNLQTAFILLAGALTAGGMNWLLLDHPSLPRTQSVEHWLLPALTTLVLGASLGVLDSFTFWWIGFITSGILLVLVFMAEYIVVEPASASYALARAGLTALSYALFLILVTSLRLAGVRLVVLLPAVLLAAWLISLRILHLDGTDRWDFPWATGISIVCVQIAAALHYWPTQPLQFGLILTGPLYALTHLSGSIAEDVPVRSVWQGPALILALSWSAALLLR